MLALILVLLLVLALAGFGFAYNWLWIIAGIVLVVWLLGFAMRGAEGARWYRW
ncbi:MAG TPA: hydrophobic protein [Actinophytocola sp.]|uniref:hydrophobic protein n=1 Tax=Actinophytocola sp. TaxID=1872138 RepID=UPI002DDD259E|nr:hydrophobic protein [Actinophytocola sp.]HEV2781191.1 hydrophobic protein [Actinophytocola sp.]